MEFQCICIYRIHNFINENDEKIGYANGILLIMYIVMLRTTIIQIE
jgi:hypothetical protein